MCETLTFLLDNIYIRFGTKLFRQIVGIPMGTYCAPLVADLFLFCNKRDFLMSLSEEKQSEVSKAFSSTSRYLDNLLNIDSNYFDGLISQIYPSELQLNKANSSETEALFFACMVVNPITVNNFASLFCCTPAGRASDVMTSPA